MGADDLVLADNWVTVPTNSVITVHKQTVMIHPVIDEIYNQSPSHTRSPKLVRDKGQMSPVTAALDSGMAGDALSEIVAPGASLVR